MGYFALLLIGLAVIVSLNSRSRILKPEKSAVRETATRGEEIAREIAFGAVQQISINQQRLVDSTEAKLGVLALAILACFVALVVEHDADMVERAEVVLLGFDSLAVLAGLLGFKHREPFDVATFVRGYKAQAPQTLDETIDAMATNYVKNETLRKIKDGILFWATVVLALVVTIDLARRYGAINMLRTFSSLWHHGTSACSVWPF
ncbi:MAG TPA: hypothetical protein VHS78_10740 [Candidatus Elarobacter sp.]|jgi:hypothetical protein|nr:hypothetical protein [Candidatus Elarobacter sp.]